MSKEMTFDDILGLQEVYKVGTLAFGLIGFTLMILTGNILAMAATLLFIALPASLFGRAHIDKIWTQLVLNETDEERLADDLIRFWKSQEIECVNSQMPLDDYLLRHDTLSGIRELRKVALTGERLKY